MNSLALVYFKTLSVTQTIQRQMFKKVSNELYRMWQEEQ